MKKRVLSLLLVCVLLVTALPFAAVAPPAWYAPGVAWANQTGIVTGTTAATFPPDRPLNREQLAAMLYPSSSQCSQGARSRSRSCPTAS